LPFWLLHGIAKFKHEIARRISLDLVSLPWRTEFINFLAQQRGEGRSLVLATGSDIRLARQVADHLKIFDRVVATDETTNFCGAAKRDYLVRHFGSKGFDYAADGGTDDLTVWASARQAVLINLSSRERRAAAAVAPVECVFADPNSSRMALVRALRLRHRLKNLLIFVPLIGRQRFQKVPMLLRTLLSFIAFGCCASSGYLFNDLIDLEADRHHPQKKFRPFAAGTAPLAYGFVAIPFLLLAGCLLAFFVSPLLCLVTLIYFLMTIAYSLHLKKVAVLDVLILAGLYSLRLMAGSAAVGIRSSHWLLAFSIFLFFSLALAKRYGELVIMHRVDGDQARARGYELHDEELLAAMGVASGYLAVLVLALYITSEKARILYDNPELLWFLCPLLLYWISHIWLTAHRGKMHHDPVVFATSDRASQILLLLMTGTAFLPV